MEFEMAGSEMMWEIQIAGVAVQCSTLGINEKLHRGNQNQNTKFKTSSGGIQNAPCQAEMETLRGSK